MGNEISVADLLQLQRNITEAVDRGRAADIAQINERFDRIEDRFERETKGLRAEVRRSASLLGSLTGKEKTQLIAAVSAGAGSVFALLAKAVPYLWHAVRHP